MIKPDWMLEREPPDVLDARWYDEELGPETLTPMRTRFKSPRRPMGSIECGYT